MVGRVGWFYFVLVNLILVGTTLLRLADPFFLQAVRLIAFDSYQRFEPQSYDPDLPVRIVDIDDESLDRVGQWPWPRTTVARMLDQLMVDGAATVVFDVLFAEADQSSPEEVVKRLGEEEAELIRPLIEGQESHDELLASVIGSGPTVLAAVLTERDNGMPVPAKAGFAVAGDDPRPFIPAMQGSANNLSILNDMASGVGAINWFPDRDQVVRRLPLVYREGEELVPSLVTEALRVAQGANTYILKASNASGETAFGEQTGLNHIKVGDLEIPTAADGAIRLQFRPSNPAAFVPAWQVLDGTYDPAQIAGRIVLVGTSAAGLSDLRATPLDAALPGVEIHAQAIEQLITGRTLSRPDYAFALELVITILACLGLSLLLPRLPATASALVGGFTIVAIVVGGWLAYRYGGLMLDPSYPALAILVLVSSATIYTHRRVEQQRGQVRRAFGHYVAPAVVDKLIADPGRLELGGEVRTLSLLFCDVRNFTSISEKMTAHELTHFINSMLSPLTEIILEHNGTIDKYMGDAIMAFWNAPLDDPDHARRACVAAVTMAARMETLNREWREEAEEAGRTFNPVAIGIGINTGDCCVGNLGSTLRFDYSAIGDEVNLASRIEGLSKVYGLPIVIGESTADACGQTVLELDLIRVKGRTKPSRLYTLPDAIMTDAQAASLSPHHTRMLEAYRARDWDAAERAVAACREVDVAALSTFYDLYAERIAAWRGTPPPPDWDGAFTATEK